MLACLLACLEPVEVKYRTRTKRVSSLCYIHPCDYYQVMADPIKKEADSDYTLATDEGKQASTAPSPSLAEEAVAGFYLNRSWYSKKNFGIYPQSGYKPVFLNELNDTIWYDFNREVEHYQSYYSRISWFYKTCTILPTLWFLGIVLPDLLWYYDVIINGVGGICGVIMALACLVDTVLQRRLLKRKVRPMYELLVATHNARFKLCGYSVSFQTERTVLDGLNSYVLFRKLPPGGDEEESPPEPTEMGFYLDEDILGKKPYALGVTSPIQAPRFLQGVDADTWKAFAKAIDDRTKTPQSYLLGPTIGMGIIVGAFVFVILYALIYLTNIRHDWIVIALVPLYFLLTTMWGFRRRHYVENVLIESVSDLLVEFEPTFAKAGYKVTFELEYMLGYFCVNTYFLFKTLRSCYGVTPLVADSCAV